MTTNGLITLELHDGWAKLLLNRPERKNSLTGPLADDLVEALSALVDNDDIRVIVLGGAGGSFCSGLDLAEFRAEDPPAWVAEFPEKWARVHELLFALPQVLITAVERYSINGGSALALAGDLCIVGENTFLEVSEAKMGMAAPRNMFWLNLRHPESVVARITLLCDRIPGPELFRLGIATEVVADDAVMKRAAELATALAEFPPGGLAAIKSSIRSSS